MSNTFLFVGDPGPGAKQKLQILVSQGATAKRLPESASVNEIEDHTPKSIILGPDVNNPERFIVSLRERRILSNVPIITRVTHIEPKLVETAFRQGCDDIIVDGRLNQFQAMVSAITENDTWDAMRAPAGVVVLAHQDRMTRMRLGQVLRRSGYDLQFAAQTDELKETVAQIKPRAVITSFDLPQNSPLSLFDKKNTALLTCPWIILSPAEHMASLSAALSTSDNVRMLDQQSDAESVTFLLNDLLAPEQKGERRTPRILFGTTVSFRPEHSERTEEFYGFSYNINIGGLFVRTITPPPMQSRLLVKFSPPHGRGLVAMIAQVVWRKAIGSTSGAATPAGMGVQFVHSWLADQKGFEAGYNALREEFNQRHVSYTSVSPVPVDTPSVSP